MSFPCGFVVTSINLNKPDVCMCTHKYKTSRPKCIIAFMHEIDSSLNYLTDIEINIQTTKVILIFKNNFSVDLCRWFC